MTNYSIHTVFSAHFTEHVLYQPISVFNVVGAISLVYQFVWLRYS